MIVSCLTSFQILFQLYRGGQCTYPCFPKVLCLPVLRIAAASSLIHIFQVVILLVLRTMLLKQQQQQQQQRKTRCVCETLMPPKYPSFEKHDPDI